MWTKEIRIWHPQSAMNSIIEFYSTVTLLRSITANSKLQSIRLVDIGSSRQPHGGKTIAITKSAWLTGKCLLLIHYSDNTFRVDLCSLANYGARPNSPSGSFVCRPIIGTPECYTPVRARDWATEVHRRAMHGATRLVPRRFAMLSNAFLSIFDISPIGQISNPFAQTMDGIKMNNTNTTFYHNKSTNLWLWIHTFRINRAISDRCRADPRWNCWCYAGRTNWITNSKAKTRTHRHRPLLLINAFKKRLHYWIIPATHQLATQFHRSRRKRSFWPCHTSTRRASTRQ